MIRGGCFEKAIAKVAIGGLRQQPLYNLSEFTFQKLLEDWEGLADNLRDYITPPSSSTPSQVK
jgi:type I restriction enzyme M protein